MVVIDKETYKMLKYIIRKHTVTHEKLEDKFGDTACPMVLVLLCKNGYLLCQRADGTYNDFEGVSYTHKGDDKYWATPQTRKYIEEISQNHWHWVVPTVIAFISLVLSAITLIYTLADKSPILVKLL